MRLASAVVAALCLGPLLGCGPSPVSAPPPISVAVPVPTAAPSAEAAAAPAESAAKAPPGYIEMTVVGLDRQVSGEGAALLLGSEEREALLRIFVGGTEALSIELRKDRRAYVRPLTHDLFDALLRELGGELVKVQVDDLRDGTFFGSVYVRQGKRVVRLDARPSDAIALALGADVPIFVAKRVVDQAAERPGEPPRR